MVRSRPTQISKRNKILRDLANWVAVDCVSEHATKTSKGKQEYDIEDGQTVGNEGLVQKDAEYPARVKD